MGWLEAGCGLVMCWTGLGSVGWAWLDMVFAWAGMGYARYGWAGNILGWACTGVHGHAEYVLGSACDLLVLVWRRLVWAEQGLGL